MKKPIKKIVLRSKEDLDSDYKNNLKRKISDDTSSDDSSEDNRNKLRKGVDNTIISTKPKSIPIPIDENDLLILSSKCNSLEDFIKVGKTFKKYLHKSPTELKITDHRFLILFKISNMTEELEKINNLIGLKKIKDELLSQISFLLSEFKDTVFLNTVISGPPGHGKTEISKLIGQAYFKSNILTKPVFIFATRSDLIGQFLGQTAIKTTEVFNKAKGGVLFIDEVYSLGSHRISGEDSFSKECIDTLNQLLSENKNTMCIVAGYSNEMDDCFFSVNKGLRSRFPWRFEIDKYNNNELYNMFMKNARDKGWKLDMNSILNEDFFKKYSNYFENAGRDIENFFTKCCMEHARIHFLDNNFKIITNEDINKAIKVIVDIIDKNKVNNSPPSSMYI